MDMEQWKKEMVALAGHPGFHLRNTLSNSIQIQREYGEQAARDWVRRACEDKDDFELKMRTTGWLEDSPSDSP